MKHNYTISLPLVILFASFLIFCQMQVYAQRNSVVEFEYLKGEFNNQGEVELTWNMVEFKGILFYEVLRSADGAIFERIDEVKSRGNSELRYVDAKPLAKKSHYLIKAIQDDDKATLSSSLCIEPDPSHIANPIISVFPNPVIRDLNIEIGPYEEVTRVSIKNTRGVTLGARHTLTGQGDKVLLRFNMASLPNGLYFVVFEMGPSSPIKSYSECVINK